MEEVFNKEEHSKYFKKGEYNPKAGVSSGELYRRMFLKSSRHGQRVRRIIKTAIC
jgi:hypothetical protein